MKVFRSGKDNAPTWSELKYFRQVTVKKGQGKALSFKENKNILFITSGAGILIKADVITACKTGDIIEKDESGDHYLSASDDIQLIHIAGYWKEPCGTKGIFKIENSDHPKNNGDPSPYDNDRRTAFDNHFHDCDEYWIILEGQLLVSSGNKTVILNAGDCLATPAGEHHDMIEIYQPVRGIWFETSLKGQKRQGHLWLHTHGPYKE